MFAAFGSLIMTCSFFAFGPSTLRACTSVEELGCLYLHFVDWWTSYVNVGWLQVDITAMSTAVVLLSEGRWSGSWLPGDLYRWLICPQSRPNRSSR